MKIALFQTPGKHAANKLYRERACLTHSFSALGHDVMQVSPEETCPLYGPDLDVILILENYHNSWVGPLLPRRGFRVFWSIDAHMAFAKHVRFCKENKVGLVLSSTFSYVKRFEKHGLKCVWFPNAFPSHLVQHLPMIAKLYDVGFCGRLLNRKGWLREIAKHFQVKRDIMVLGMGMVNAINRYRIHWNRNISNDINYRTFETLGCGTCLLTNFTDKLHRLFDIGKHLMVYDSIGDCLEKIQYLLDHEGIRERIASAGRAHALRNHTYDVRAAQFLEIVKPLV